MTTSRTCMAGGVSCRRSSRSFSGRSSCLESTCTSGSNGYTWPPEWPANESSCRSRSARAAAPLTRAGGLHAILDVVLEGQKTAHASILKDYQQDPIRGHISHVDLQEVRLDQPIQASVTVQLVGEPAGAKEGGVLSQVQREVNVEALPMEIPEHIDLDVSGMAIGDTLRLADLAPIEGVTYLDDPEETVLASVGLPTKIEEPEPEEVPEGEELPEGEVPEGEEAPEGAADQPAEP